MIIEFTRDALNHLEAISEYIAADNPPAADRMVQRIRFACRSLAVFPERHHLGIRPNTHELVVAPYIIQYQILPEKTVDGVVAILGIFHGARDQSVRE